MQLAETVRTAGKLGSLGVHFSNTGSPTTHEVHERQRRESHDPEHSEHPSNRMISAQQFSTDSQLAFIRAHLKIEELLHQTGRKH